MSSSLLTYAFWIAPIPVLVFLAATMIRRNLRREFPVFFIYVVLQIISILLNFACFHWSYKVYFCVYWLMSALGVVLGFAVIREIFTNLFRQYDALRDLGSVLFRWAAVVLVMVSVVTVASGSSSKVGGLIAVIFALERSVRVMQCGLVLFMLLFSAHLGITSRHHVFGVSLGFGLFAAVELIIVTLYAPGTQKSVTLSLLKGATYVMSTLVWAWYMLLPEPEQIKEQAHQQSERWNVALANIRDPEYNFLPMVESVVERVLSQRHIEIEQRPDK